MHGSFGNNLLENFSQNVSAVKQGKKKTKTCYFLLLRKQSCNLYFGCSWALLICWRRELDIWQKAIVCHWCAFCYPYKKALTMELLEKAYLHELAESLLKFDHNNPRSFCSYWACSSCSRFEALGLPVIPTRQYDVLLLLLFEWFIHQLQHRAVLSSHVYLKDSGVFLMIISRLGWRQISKERTLLLSLLWLAHLLAPNKCQRRCLYKDT